jgi:AcrR family transcriptional regulator
VSDPATTAADEPVRRRRGRPRKGESDARDRILAAATDEFGEHGYDASTTRAIAGRAGVDPALLHHHFGTKADLFAASIGAPLRPDLAVPEILTGPREQTGERLVAYVLAMWDSPTVGPRALVMLRTSLASKRATPLLAGFLRRELLDKVAAGLDAPDAGLRADLAASQIAGLIIARYVLRLPDLVAAPTEVLVARVGATVQGYLVD